MILILMCIDNHSSYCVSNNKQDFVGQLEPMNANIKGVGGSVKVRYKGAVKWQWETDLRQVTTHFIQDTLFMLTSPDRILSPQHWSQQRAEANDTTAQAITNHTSTKLVWDNGHKTKTVPLNAFTKRRHNVLCISISIITCRSPRGIRQCKRWRERHTE